MSIEEKYKIGQAILTQLFAMPFDELRAKVKDICGDKVYDNGYIWESGEVHKTSHNDQPQQITISYYDSIIIGSFGISIKYEHKPTRNIIDFDQYFKL